MAAIFMTGRSLKCPVLVSVTSKSSQGMRQNEFISHKAAAKTPHQWKNMSTDDRSNLQQFNECKQCGHSRWGSGLPKANPKRKFHYIFKYMCICTYRSVSNEERTFLLVLLYCRLIALVVERQKSKFSNSHEFIYLHHFNGHLKCQQRRCCASIYIYIVIIKICKKLLENAYMLNSYFSCSYITSLVLLMIN